MTAGRDRRCNVTNCCLLYQLRKEWSEVTAVTGRGHIPPFWNKATRSQKLIVRLRTSPGLVIGITACSDTRIHNDPGRQNMPILMVALLALAVFGGIGALLAVAVLLESKQKTKA